MGMKRATVLGGMFVVLCGLSGCANRVDTEAALKERIQLLKETAKVLNSIKDAPSAEQARAELRKLDERLTDNSKRVGDTMKELPKEERDRLEQKYLADLSGAFNECLQASVRAGQTPAGAETLKELKALSKQGKS